MDTDNINREGERILDKDTRMGSPTRHSFVPDGNPLTCTRCLLCSRPLDEHWGLVRRAWAWLWGRR
jgi:hypothetical protein